MVADRAVVADVLEDRRRIEPQRRREAAKQRHGAGLADRAGEPAGPLEGTVQLGHPRPVLDLEEAGVGAGDRSRKPRSSRIARRWPRMSRAHP